MSMRHILKVIAATLLMVFVVLVVYSLTCYAVVYAIKPVNNDYRYAFLLAFFIGLIPIYFIGQLCRDWYLDTIEKALDQIN